MITSARMSLVLVAVMTAAALLSAACSRDEAITGSGNIVTQAKDVRDFTGVEIGNTFEVTVRQAAAFKVEVSADDNLIDKAVVTKNGDALKLGIQPGLNLKAAVWKADISMPRLRAVRLSGASRATVTGFRSTEAIDITVAGASRVEGDLEAATATITPLEASRVTLTGSARKIVLKGSGASSINLMDFLAPRATIELSDASTAMVNIKDVIESITLNGAARLVYAGTPILDQITASGASTISHKASPS